ncbi:MAG: hypothetical protein KGY99_03855 [Phycisphaerae bacterium]|nr:hypothetical protein [Phycisphaerae bacterium]
MTRDDDTPRFFCDAMHGGLARWLRAAGYDAAFAYGIDDADLIERASRTGRMILSSDGPLFDRNVVRDGAVAALYVPRGLGKLDALAYVLRTLELPIRSPRCMACGGALHEVPKHSVIHEAPPRTYRSCERFWRCARCGKLLWRGTHWRRITRKLAEIAP